MKMADIDVSKIPDQEAYRILIGAIVLRPVAWVSTISASGVTDLAPFRFFSMGRGVCSLG